MKKWLLSSGGIGLMLLLGSCAGVGEKSASLSVIYIAAAVLSLLMLVGYCCFVRKKSVWFLVMFAAILVVNVGYYSLSVSKTLSWALMSNRIAYLGSVFLPMVMLMIIMDTVGTLYKKWLPLALLGLSILVWLVAASPGILPIYYREVSLEIVHGVSSLNKVYGPLHPLYLFYLVGYFSAMLVVIGNAMVKKKLDTAAQAVFVLIAVFVNLGVWFIEQLVKIDFEFLCVSYIISELFLLGLQMLVAQQHKEQTAPVEVTAEVTATPEPEDTLPLFRQGLSELTPTENTVYQLYLSGMSTKEVLEKMNIKENTLKYHNRNIYSKLGVSSRKQLLELAKRCQEIS